MPIGPTFSKPKNDLDLSALGEKAEDEEVELPFDYSKLLRAKEVSDLLRERICEQQLDKIYEMEEDKIIDQFFLGNLQLTFSQLFHMNTV